MVTAGWTAPRLSRHQPQSRRPARAAGLGVLADRPARDRFLYRNRIIAALGAAGMTVPGAGIRSGTLNAVG
ncbi:hypothetical protein [Nocardia asteroides]